MQHCPPWEAPLSAAGETRSVCWLRGFRGKHGGVAVNKCPAPSSIDTRERRLLPPSVPPAVTRESHHGWARPCVSATTGGHCCSLGRLQAQQDPTPKLAVSAAGETRSVCWLRGVRGGHAAVALERRPAREPLCPDSVRKWTWARFGNAASRSRRLPTGSRCKERYSTDDSRRANLSGWLIGTALVLSSHHCLVTHLTGHPVLKTSD